MESVVWPERKLRVKETEKVDHGIDRALQCSTLLLFNEKNKSLMNAHIEVHTSILNGAKYIKSALISGRSALLRLYTVEAHASIRGATA